MLNIKKNPLRKTQNHAILISFQRGTEIMKGGYPMINIRTMKKLQNGDGFTLKNGKLISYKTGWQVADHGVECTTPEAAMRAVKEMKGSCGVWLENGIYYVDHSFRVPTKKAALEIGRRHNQISVFGWRKMNLAYC